MKIFYKIIYIKFLYMFIYLGKEGRLSFFPKLVCDSTLVPWPNN